MPTWARIGAITAGVVLVVGLVALIALVVPPVGEAFRDAPVIVIVLVIGTVLVLATTIRAALRRP